MPNMMRTIRGGAVLAVVALTAGCATTMEELPPGASTPGEVVAIAMAANTGEVVTSRPVTGEASNQRVRQFAQQMITDHTRANEQIEALGVAPRPNSISRELTASAQETARVLRMYEGEELDRTYMNAQVKLHEYTLESLDDHLIPSTRDPELRQVLQQMRATVASHLEQARQIRRSL